MPAKYVHRFRKSIAAMLLAASVLVTSPRSALADGPGKLEDSDHYDARVQGYSTPDVELPAGSSGMCWFLMIVMAVATCSIIFKDAKRSHLD